MKRIDLIVEFPVVGVRSGLWHHKFSHTYISEVNYYSAFNKEPNSISGDLTRNPNILNPPFPSPSSPSVHIYPKVLRHLFAAYSLDTIDFLICASSWGNPHRVITPPTHAIELHSTAYYIKAVDRKEKRFVCAWYIRWNRAGCNRWSQFAMAFLGRTRTSHHPPPPSGM